VIDAWRIDSAAEKNSGRKKKVLLTGASGFLGWNVCTVAREDVELFGVVFSHPLKIEGVKIVRADLTDALEMKRIFNEIRPEAVIHTAASSHPNFCELNRAHAYKINVEASFNIADLCAEHSIPCVFTSSDLVFDGLHPPYREDDPVCPVNAYGEQKAMAEAGMVQRYPAVTICRMPLMFGVPGPAATSFIQPMIEAMRAERELKLFTDEFRTPSSGQDAVRGLFIALERTGEILHLGGPERISRFDFGRLLQEVLGLDRAVLKPCRRRDVQMAAARPPDVSLDGTKAFRIGFHSAPPGKALLELAALL